MIHQIKLIYLLYFNGRSGRGFRRWQFLEEKHYERAKADILTKNKMKVILGEQIGLLKIQTEIISMFKSFLSCMSKIFIYIKHTIKSSS